MNEVLSPVLVLGTGRTGSTFMMAMLAGADEVACDLVHPYEHRYLTEFLKQALSFEEPFGRSIRDRSRWSLGDIGTPPPPAFGKRSLLKRGHANGEYWRRHFRSAWAAFSGFVREGDPGLRYYAEKYPLSLLSVLEPIMPVFRVYLLRDPRDSWCSVKAFDRRRGFHGFGRKEDETAEKYLDRYLAWHELYLKHLEKEEGRQGAILVRYEDLVADPDGVAGRVGDVLEIEIDADLALDRCARFKKHRTSPDLQLSVGRYRNDLEEWEATRFNKRLARRMKSFGYA